MSNISSQSVDPTYHASTVFSMMSRFHRMMFHIVTMVFFMIALIMICFGFFTLTALIIKDFDLLLCLVSAFIVLYGMLMLYFLWNMLIVTTADYEFRDDGLEVHFLFHQPKVIPWNHFQAVGIYLSKTDPRYQAKAKPILCCVMKGEKQNVYGFWKLLHTKRVIQMRYSDELFTGLQEKCTIPVSDMRPLPYNTTR